MLAKPDQPLRCQTSLQLTLLAPLHPVLVLSCFSLLSSRHLCPFWPLLNRELTTVPVHDWFFHWWVVRNPEIGKPVQGQSDRAIILITTIQELIIAQRRWAGAAKPLAQPLPMAVIMRRLRISGFGRLLIGAFAGLAAHVRNVP